MRCSPGKRGLILSSAILILPILSQTVSAGGFALREQSSYYQGLSFAGNATSGPSISSVFWNPATITSAKDGLTAELHNTFIIPRSYIDVSPSSTLAAYGDSGDIASDAWVGSTYLSYKVNDRIYVGLGVNAPFGLSTKPNFTWAGQVYNRSSKVFSINANPMIGYKVNDVLSIALGAQIEYMSVRLKSASSAAIGAASSALVNGSAQPTAAPSQTVARAMSAPSGSGTVAAFCVHLPDRTDKVPRSASDTWVTCTRIHPALRDVIT